MKRQFTILTALLLLMTGVVFGQSPYQFPNPDFENGWHTGSNGASSTSSGDPVGWHSFDENTGSQSGLAGGSINARCTGYTGYGCDLKAKGIWVVLTTIVRNGAMTTGQTVVGSTSGNSCDNYNVSNTSYNHPFTGKPDSLSFRTKANFSTQACVKVWLHSSLNFKDYACNQEDPWIGKCVQNFSGTGSLAGNWKRECFGVVYSTTNTGTPGYMLASFSTNKAAAAGNKNDELYLDNLRCIYNKQLNTLTINGSAATSILTAFNNAEYLKHDELTGSNSGSTQQNYTGSVCYSTAADLEALVSATAKSPRILSITKTGSISGTYPHVDIVVTHNDNSTFTYTINFTDAHQTPTASIATPSTTVLTCTTPSITLTANSGSGFTYQWQDASARPPVNISGATGRTFTVTSAGTYRVIVSNGGCTATSSSITITSNTTPPTVTLTANPTSVCAGGSSVLTAGGANTYSWSDGLGTGTTKTVTPSATKSYTVTGTSTSNGCTNTASVTVAVNPAPTVSLSSNATQSVCVDAAIQNITVTSANGTLSATGLPTGVTLSGNTISGTPTATGTFNYTITNTSSAGCTPATATGVITVNAKPTVTISGNSTICQGQTATLTANATGCTFAWNNGTSGAQNAVTTAGNYVVTATNSNNCTATASQSVTVNANPTVSISGNNTICQGQTATLTANATGCTFAWSNGTNGAQNAVTAAGNYVVTAKNSNNCTATASQNVTVNPTYNQDEYLSISTAQLPYTWRGHVIPVGTTTSDIVYNGQSAQGCDSVVTLHLTVATSTYTLTINYQYANGTQAAPTHTESVAFGANYSVTSPTITGYTADQTVVSGTMPAENRTVTVIYSINSYTLTVNYQYANGTQAAASHTESVNYNASYSVTSPTITGYTANQTVVSGTMPAENVTETVTYNVNSYTITYKVDGTTYTTQTYNYGAAVTAPTAPTKTGYTFAGWTPTLPTTMPAENLEEVANWNVNSYTLTINYEYADHSPAATTHTESVNYNASYSVTSPEVAGYAPSQAVVSGTMPANDVTVTVTYGATTRPLTIHYYYADYSQALPDYTGNVQVGNTYAVTSPAITGYTPNVATIEGTMGESGAEYNVVYNVNSYTLTINYEYADHSQAATAYTASVDYNTSYSVESPVITGYSASQTTVSGIMPANDVTVTVTYSAEMRLLTIHYYYADYSVAHADYTGNVQIGSTYAVTSPTITGYTPNVATIEGTMGESGAEYNVVYNVNSYTLTVNYQYSNGTQAAVAHTESVNYGASYSVTSPTITGYTADQTVISGTMPADNVTATVTYNVNSYTLTINYEYADHSPAATTHTESVNYNASYSVTSPEVAGYAPSQAVVSGTMPANDVTVTVTYGATTRPLTIHYYYADYSQALPDYTGNVQVGNTYAVTSPAITGYTPNVATIEGTMGESGAEYNVVYNVNSYTLTVNYEYADHSQASATHTESVNYNASYSVTSPTITGYTADQTVVSGTMSADDVTVTVTYNVNGYTITYMVDGVTYTTQNYNFGAAVTAPTVPTKIGYTFTIWNPALPATMPAENLTVNAQWSINQYTITYQDGTVQLGQQTYDYNAAVTAIENPTKTGYTFTGWSPEIPANMPAENVMVTAQWSINQYTITYQDGTTQLGQQTYDYDAAVTAIANPTKTGYTFIGWNPTVPTNMPAENVTVNAQWNINSYTLTVNYEYTDGTQAASTHTESVNYNATYTVESPAITGYTADQTIVSGTMPAENVTATVVYTIVAPIVGNIATPDDICSGASLTLTAPSVQYATTTGWQIAYDAEFTSPAEYNGQTMTMANDGWYLRYWATNTTGTTYSNVAVITVNQVPTVSVTVNGTTASVDNPQSGMTYTWSTGATGTSIAGLTNGNYSVTATNDLTGCLSIAYFTASNIATEVTILSSEADNIYICSGSTLDVVYTATATPAGQYTYQWIVNGLPQTETGNQLTITYDENSMSNNNIEVFVTGADNWIPTYVSVTPVHHQSETASACGSYTWHGATYTTSGTKYYRHNVGNCQQVDTLYLTINPLPAVPTLATSDNTSCSVQNGSITVSNPTGADYQYALGNGSFQTSNVFNNLSAGTYTITVKNVNTTCTSQGTATVETTGSVVTATASANTPCVGGTLNLTGSSQTAGVTYAWSGPNGFTANTQNATINNVPAEAAGTYTLVVTETSTGCSTNKDVLVTLNALPTIEITGNNFFCEGGNTTVEATGATNYVWSNGGNDAAITVNAAATYTVTGTDANGCSNTASVSVEERQNPTLNVSGNLTFCEEGSTTLTASGAQSYTWYDADEHSATGASYRVSAEGTYRVVGVAANTCSAEQTVEVFELPRPTVTITGEPSFCYPQGATTLTAEGASTYVWSNGRETSSIDAGQVQTYSVTGTAANGCSNTASVAVTAKNRPSLVISGERSFCEGGSTTLTASGATSYSWTLPQQAAVTAESYTFSSATSAVVTAYGNNGCTTTEEIEIVENELPTVPTLNTVNNTSCQVPNGIITVTEPVGANYAYALGSGTYRASNAFSGLSAGNYTIYVKNTTTGCVNQNVASIVSVGSALTATADVDAVCAGETLSFIGQSNIADGVTYAWNGPNGFVANVQNPTITNAAVVNAGAYTLVVTETATGCTAEAQVTAVVNVPVHNHTTQVACESYEWNGTTYTTSGTYTYGHEDANGCQQVDTLHLTINNPAHTAITASVCDEYVWNRVDGTTASYNESGDYTYAHQDANGCQQVDTLHLTITNTPQVTVSGLLSISVGHSTELTAMGAESYEWATGETTPAITVAPEETTAYSVVGRNGDCVAEPVTVTVTVSECIPGMYEFNYTECDSYEWHGNVYTTSTDAQYVMPNMAANGCDSIVVMHLTINHATTAMDEQTACEEFEWIDGNVYTESTNTPTVTLTNAHGCDSVVTLHLTIYNPTHTALTETACDQYVWKHLDGTTETLYESNDYTYEHVDAHGCTQVDTLHLTIVNTPEVTVTGNTNIFIGRSTTLTAAGAESYVWSTDETTPSITVAPEVTTAYSVVGSNGNCDATPVQVVVNVSECEPGTSAFNHSACESYEWHGQVYTQSTDAQYVLPNMSANGCDSIVTMHLTILNPVHRAESASECESYTWNDEVYTESGDYTYGHEDANGCWQVDTLHLTIFNPAHTATTATACDEYVWNHVDGTTSTYDESGIFTYSHEDAHGCTQVDTLHLTINYTQYTIDKQVACDAFTWIDGNVYTQDNNTATFTYTGANGCDSIVTLSLIVNHSTSAIDEQVACESFTWIDGNIYTESTDTPTFTLENEVGCDSVVTLHLTINNPTHTAITETACGSYTWNGSTLVHSGDYIYRHDDANGCEQVDTLHLTIFNPVHTAITEVACDSYTWIREDGTSQTYTRSGNYIYRHEDANGCQQGDTLHLTINHPTTGTDVQTACESFTWIDGNTYTASTNDPMFTIENGAANGCDSVVTLHLTINQPTTGTDVQTACESFTWIDGNTYTASNNTATVTLTNHLGCDSIVTLNLTLVAPDHQSYTVSECESYVWAAPLGDGNTYTTSGTYLYRHDGEYDCQQVDTLHLTINNPQHLSIVETACDSIVWNGQTYRTDGDYTYGHEDVNGCWQVDTLHLTVKHSAETIINATICNGATYNDHGFVEHMEGVYYRRLEAANGCDSVVVLNLTIDYNCEFTCGESLYDIDYNTYSTHAYGHLCWMTENLRTTRYSDGVAIPMAAAYRGDVNDDENANVAVYGRLYDWASASREATAQPVQGACPQGWRLPTNDEYRALANTYGANGLRSTDYWLTNTGTNASLFDMRPGGFYNGSANRFENKLGEAYFYTADGADGSQVTHLKAMCGCWELIFGNNQPADAYSVRCVKALY